MRDKEKIVMSRISTDVVKLKQSVQGTVSSRESKSEETQRVVRFAFDAARPRLRSR